ncbi:hypothetical protein, partial [Teichococcus deserti]|uniref:hypothetical protein n=1 Tax=Teichococcus deserti TaxID=1817963 RepID=UPI0010541E9A
MRHAHPPTLSLPAMSLALSRLPSGGRKSGIGAAASVALHLGLGLLLLAPWLRDGAPPAGRGGAGVEVTLQSAAAQGAATIQEASTDPVAEQAAPLPPRPAGGAPSRSQG